MPPDDDPQGEDRTGDATAEGGDGGEPPRVAGPSEDRADPSHNHWLDIGKTVVAGIITAGVLHFIRGGRR